MRWSLLLCCGVAGWAGEPPDIPALVDGALPEFTRQAERPQAAECAWTGPGQATVVFLRRNLAPGHDLPVPSWEEWLASQTATMQRLAPGFVQEDSQAGEGGWHRLTWHFTHSGQVWRQKLLLRPVGNTVEIVVCSARAQQSGLEVWGEALEAALRR